MEGSALFECFVLFYLVKLRFWAHFHRVLLVVELLLRSCVYNFRSSPPETVKKRFVLFFERSRTDFSVSIFSILKLNRLDVTVWCLYVAGVRDTGS